MKALSQALLMALVFVAQPSAALTVSDVAASKRLIGKPGDGPLAVTFTLSAPADVALKLYDARNYLVREVLAESTLTAGEHTLYWDLSDVNGEAVPDGQYVYTLEAREPAGGTGSVVIYDLTDLTGGERVTARQVAWDEGSQKISYVLPEPALVNIRIGLKDGGPLLQTVIDWLPRAAGANDESWDGMDASGYINLGKHEQRYIGITAYSYSDNTILLGSSPRATRYIDLPEDARTARPKSGNAAKKRPLRPTPLQKAPQDRGDVGIALRVGTEYKVGEDKVPLVSGKVPFRLNVAQDDRAKAASFRFEAIFYVDGLKVFENEIGFFPMTWYWDATNVNSGVHYITANLVGYEGNFGVATVKVRVQ